MLELKDVRFSVTDEKGQLKNIINGINLKIDEGKFVAITGPNGSGKSTLAKLIVGFIQWSGYYGNVNYRQSKAWNKFCISAACTF